MTGSDLMSIEWTRHAADNLHGGRPAGPGPRPVLPPRSPRPAQDGSPLAQEPRPDPRPDRPLCRRLPKHCPTLPRPIPRGRTAASASMAMASAPERTGRAPGLPGGVLPEATGPLRQAGPGYHRAADRPSQEPQPGPPLPQGPAGAAVAQDRGDPRPSQEDGRGARPRAGCLRAGEVGTTPGAGPPGPEATVLRRRRPLRVRAVPGLLVVRGAAVRAGGLGSQAIQRPGGAGRGDAPADPGDQSRLHQRRVGLRAVAGGGGGRGGVPITRVLDNARYQKCAVVQTLAASLGIELLYLPGYSPNLNLIERLWRFVRKQSLDSTYYESFEQFTAAIDECLDSLPTVHKSEMETLLTHKFQMFEDGPLLAA